MLELVDEPYARSVLVNAIEEADRLQRADPAYAGELHRWSGRSGASEEGVLAANAADAETYGDLRLRVFDGTPHRAGISEDDGAAGELLLLGTASDDAEARLRAGEATSAVLLAATADGLATCPLSQALEIGSTRAVVQEINGAGIVPQMVLRIGWPTLAGHPLARTPRRHIDDVIGPLE